jgi:nitrate/TMAO reductase-like tetraheme cytochrome c subunit
MWLGSFIMVASFGLGCVLLVSELFINTGNPYVSLATFTVPPAGLTLGGALLALGALLKWRERKKNRAPRSLPVLDLNNRRSLVALFTGGIAAVLFLAISSVATYRAYHFTESTEFCGTVCHKVMEPEYEAHKNSSHARVDCVSCHIGSGAEWYVRAKFSGLRQVYAVLTSDYDMPIKTPIHNLRPARDTCEQCHWPAKFAGSKERILWRYWFDKDNTPSRYHLLMKVGGVNPASGRREGIHWHIDSKETVSYWARDERRFDIPWVEVRRADGTRTVYRSEDVADPPPAQLRQMDCIDCHNRPAHVMLAPSELVDMALAEGQLDRHIPYMKRNAVEILSVAYGSRDKARRGIAEGVRRHFPVDGGDMTADEQAGVVATLTALHDRHDFPDQGASWRTYPSHLSHKVTLGCFRCHDDRHKAPDGKVISRDCNLCHDLIHQAYGEAAYGPVTFRTREFEHPPGREIPYGERLCSECHDPKVSWYPANAASALRP